MKDRKTYKALTLVGLLFPFGINRMYLGESWFMRAITLNYLWVGSFTDLLYMDKRFDEAMAKRGFTNTNIRNEQGK